MQLTPKENCKITRQRVLEHKCHIQFKGWFYYFFCHGFVLLLVEDEDFFD